MTSVLTLSRAQFRPSREGGYARPAFTLAGQMSSALRPDFRNVRWPPLATTDFHPSLRSTAMSQHALSFTDVGSLVDCIYSDVLGGAALQRPVDMIRSKFSATYAELTIERRTQTIDLTRIVSGDDHLASSADRHDIFQAGDSVSRRRCELAHHIAAAETGQKDRYQLRMFRSPGSTPFAEDETRLSAMLLSHVRRALELAARFDATESERKLYSSVMDKLLVGVILIDRGGVVLQTTAMAATTLEKRDGLQLVGGRLCATSAKEDKALQIAFKESLGRKGERKSASRALSLSRKSGARNLGVIVQPLAADDDWHSVSGAAAAVFIRDAECGAEVETNLLCELFDLTPAEAAVAHRLANGLSLEEAADALSIRRNTVRAHLRSIFSKSGITRQTELVRLMLNSAAVLGTGAIHAH